MYPYVFVAGPNKHDNLPVFSLAWKLPHKVVVRDTNMSTRYIVINNTLKTLL